MPCAVLHVMPLWCRVTMVDPEGIALAAGVLEGPAAPDIGAVDDVARLALLAKRLGGGLVPDRRRLPTCGRSSS